MTEDGKRKREKDRKIRNEVASAHDSRQEKCGEGVEK